MSASIGNAKMLARVEEAWRQLAGTAFLQPDVVGSVRYAITEGAETDDANMREERAGDARNNARNMDSRKEWGQAGFMLLTAVMQVKANGGGLVLAEKYPAFNQPPAWLYGAFMGCLANYVQEVATNHPFAKSGQSLAFAWLYWRQYAEARGWHAYDLIDETCRAFEAKHVAGWGVSSLARRTARDAQRAVQSRYRGADADTVRQQLIVELVHLWKFTPDEAERAARWAMLEPANEVASSLELSSSETAQHDLPVVKGKRDG